MAVTIYDIAERAGVSTATVSRVLNNSARVAESTRARVCEAAEALHYQPHVSAQSLARQRTSLIAAVVPVLTNYFYMEVLRGMQDALADSAYALIIYAAPSPEEADEQIARALQRGRAEGVLILSSPLVDDRLRLVGRASTPVVLVDAHHDACDSICVDNQRGGYVATQSLMAAGCRRVAYVTVTPEPRPGVERRLGYLQALSEAGRPAEAGLVAHGRSCTHGFSEQSGYQATQRLLVRSDRPDGIFAATDVSAIGAIRAVREAGLRVPEDVAVLGFDGAKPSEYVGLSTMRQPMKAMGRRAVEMLLNRMHEPAGPVETVVLQPELVCRETGGVPVDDPVADGPIADGPIADGPIADGPIADGPIADDSSPG